MKGDNNMKKNVKSTIGNLAINLGKHAVGKCMIPGMFDPKIPYEIKGDKQNTRVVFRKDT